LEAVLQVLEVVIERPLLVPLEVLRDQVMGCLGLPQNYRCELSLVSRQITAPGVVEDVAEDFRRHTSSAIDRDVMYREADFECQVLQTRIVDVVKILLASPPV
jgi:hypothetical protein